MAFEVWILGAPEGTCHGWDSMLACKQTFSWGILSTHIITITGLLCSNNGHGGDLPLIAFDILTTLALVSKWYTFTLTMLPMKQVGVINPRFQQPHAFLCSLMQCYRLSVLWEAVWRAGQAPPACSRPSVLSAGSLLQEYWAKCSWRPGPKVTPCWNPNLNTAPFWEGHQKREIIMAPS